MPFLQRSLHRLLLRFPPEFAHHVAIFFLKIYQFFFCRKQSRSFSSDGKQLKTVGRVGLAAGFDKNAEVFAALSTFGFGFIEVGTITPLPQSGNAKPRLWRVPPAALVNHLGFNSLGMEKIRENIEHLRRKARCPILANIGKNRNTPLEEAIEDYATLFDYFSDSVDGFVINLSSPNTPGLKLLQNEDFLSKIANKSPALAVFIKLSPDLSNDEIRRLAMLVRDEKSFSGIVLTNTSRTLAEKEGREVGGLSGRPLFERSLECVAIAREAIGDKTVIGVGGISSVSDAKKMLQAGAQYVEVYTAFVYQGPEFIQKLNRDLT